jgi:hypothetical protein
MALTAAQYAAAIPATPITYEYIADFIASLTQAQADATATAAQQAPGPTASGYLGWTCPVGQATSTAALTTTDIYVIAVYVPVGGTTSALDVYATTTGTVTVADAGLFTLAGVQVAEALTANLTTHSAAWGSGLNTWGWASSAPVTGGTTYYVTIETTNSAQPSLAAQAASPVINANLPTNQYNYATYSTGTVPASITPASLSGATTAVPWVGLR